MKSCEESGNEAAIPRRESLEYDNWHNCTIIPSRVHSSRVATPDFLNPLIMTLVARYCACNAEIYITSQYVLIVTHILYFCVYHDDPGPAVIWH